MHNGISISPLICEIRCKAAFPGISNKEKSGFCRQGYCICAWEEWVDELGLTMPRESPLDKIDKLQKSYNKKLQRKSLKKGKTTEPSIVSTEHLDRASCSRWDANSHEATE
ncbi:hypothetical protein QAD02_023959 [Eretmocerus hayati]|uniref:Uncharacterized protein n=1 Tax=Eretmocerus hayati TaxID=131215 RepID=A0ACC2PX13_9HYME|nr:hypothetical protein QAD02_023959 [Eretmocerus hayati]